MTTHVAPLKISWSRLKEYETCKHRVLKQLQGHKKGTRDGRNFLAGTVCDRVMRLLLEHDDPKPGMMLEWLPQVLEKHAHHSDEYVIHWRGDPRRDFAEVRALCELVLMNLEPMLFTRIIPKNYEAEVRFGFKDGPQPIIGVPGLDGIPRPVLMIGGMDILTQDPEDESWYGLYDLKATSSDAYVRGSILAQLTFYAIVVKVLFGHYPKEMGFLTPGTSQHFVPVVIGQEEIRTMYGRIEKYAHGVWSKDWRPKEEVDSDCNYNCDVKHACDLFKLPQGQRISFAEMAQQRRTARAG